MEAICESENLRKALKNVIQNKGAAGVDGMRVEELTSYLKANWPRIKEDLLEGKFEWQPVKEVEIPKPGFECAIGLYIFQVSCCWFTVSGCR